MKNPFMVSDGFLVSVFLAIAGTVTLQILVYTPLLVALNYSPPLAVGLFLYLSAATFLMFLNGGKMIEKTTQRPRDMLKMFAIIVFKIVAITLFILQIIYLAGHDAALAESLLLIALALTSWGAVWGQILVRRLARQ